MASHRAHALGALAAFSLAASTASSESQWVTRAPLPVARQEVAVAALGERVFVIGGLGPIGEIVDTVEIYDPTLDAWSDVSPLPVPLHHAAAAAVDETLYVFGGWDDSFSMPRGELYAYDLAGDEWIERAPLPSPRGSPAAVALEGRLYAIGGFPDGSAFTVYDPALDEWTPLPDLPTPRNHLGAAVLAGKIYAVGGRIGSPSPEQNSAVLEVFEPATNEWSAAAPMPTPRSGHVVAAHRCLLLAFGGEEPGAIFEASEAYDPDANSWSQREPMPTGRHGTGAAVLADGVHVPGGGPVAGFGATAVHEVFVPEPRSAAAQLAAWLALAAIAAARL